MIQIGVGHYQCVRGGRRHELWMTRVLSSRLQREPEGMSSLYKWYVDVDMDELFVMKNGVDRESKE